nr:TonB-dependent receptor [Pedobacter sp. SYSU D00823]
MIGLITLETFAQGTGKIVGKVTDKKTGETLIGLNVKIVGQTKGASTDVEGRYVISGLAAGKYSIQFSYVGYATKTISDVAVSAGTVTTLNTLMEEGGSNQLKAVVVNVTARAENTSALYASQKSSVRVSDGVSADQIKRSPDRSTGEVLKRVSGTSIQDNKFVVVRGLSDRYNTTLMNNAPMPSSEPDRKAFSFDIVPSNLIDQVVINKTAAADLPGDFAGGAVQMKTKDFPDQKVIDVSYSVGYNSLATFNNFNYGSRGKFDFLSFDDGSRALPSSFPSTRTAFINAGTDQRFAYSRSFNNSWGVSQGTSIPSQSFQVVFGNSYVKENNNKLGVLLSLSYRYNNGYTRQRRADFNEQDLGYIFDYNDNVYTNSATLGGLANFTYSYKKSKLSLKNLYNRSFEDAYTSRTGFSYEAGVSTPDEEQRNSQFQLTQKAISNSTLEGEHLLGNNKSKVDWNLSFSSSSRNQPDLRRIYYAKEYGSSEDLAAAVPVGSASPKNAGRFFQELQDYIYGASVNFSTPFKWKEKSQNLKIGLWNQYRSRDYSLRQLGYKQSNSETFDRSFLYLPEDQIFSSATIGPNGFVLDDITNPNNAYDATGLLNAGYIMTTNELLPKLKLNLGVRAESYIEDLNAGGFNKEEDVHNTYLDILPSVNLIYSVSDKSNFRLSYSNTLARAEFRELAEVSFFDFETNNVVKGNSDLKRSRINNFDARFEHFPSGGQILSASAFYKDFSNAIEQVFETGSTAASKTVSYQNATKANLFGVELEARQKLSFIGDKFWSNVSAYANASFMKSDVSIDKDMFPNNNNSRALQGQSPYLLNGGLSYTGKVWNFNALYNRTGRRISTVGFGQYLSSGQFDYTYKDVMENPRDVIDFQISRRLLRNKGEFKLNINDILNQSSILYQDMNDDGKYNKGTDHTLSSRTFGTNVNLSFTYRL